MQLDNYKNFQTFFIKNKSKGVIKFEKLHKQFCDCFNNVIKSGTSPFKALERSKKIAISLILRATKYLFTIYELVSSGHIEEGRILQRSVVELLLVARLIDKSEQAFSMWESCFQLRLQNTDKEGNINIENLKIKKFEVDELVKKNSEIIKNDEKLKFLKEMRGVFSTMYSHENLYNIVSRIEDPNPNKSYIYIGQSVDSNNDRMEKHISYVIDLMSRVKDLLDDLLEAEK